MKPSLFEKVQSYFGLSPQVFTSDKKKESGDAPDKVVPYTPSPIQAFAKQLDDIVSQMAELEGAAESFKAHTYINEIGKRTFGDKRKPSGNIIEQAMEKAEAALDDMVASFGTPFGQPLKLSPGNKKSKHDQEYEARHDPDLSLTDNRSSVTLFSGAVLTYTKVMNADNKVEAVKPKIEITTPEGEKMSASISDTLGLQRILDEGLQPDAPLNKFMDPLLKMIMEARNALVDAQITGIVSRPDLNEMMEKATPGRFGPN